MMFKRKAYDELMDWKKKFSGRYAALLEGARRVGKSTIAEEFAKNNYKSYILIDFSHLTMEEEEIFEDINNLDFFFMRLEASKNIKLERRNSVIIFDEIQFAPKVRQAIKHLVKDGRYDYIETGSLISIKKNVKDILIPSEEHKIEVYPMDYEEFCWAIDYNYDLLREVNRCKGAIGPATNRKLMRDFRLYMAVGGMPQAVDCYLREKNMLEVDQIKKEILSLYHDDFYKLDQNGRLSLLFDSIPTQLASHNKFYLTKVTGKKITSKDLENLYNLIDSKTVLPCYRVNDPSLSLNATKNLNDFKLYLSDIGLFTTMIFNDKTFMDGNIYTKLLSDKLDINLGYLYENAMAQILMASHRKLYFYTFKNKNSTHNYEIDFLTTAENKLVPIEVKSSDTKNHKSILEFMDKYSARIKRSLLFSQNDISNDEMLELKPLYLAEIILSDLK